MISFVKRMLFKQFTFKIGDYVVCNKFIDEESRRLFEYKVFKIHKSLGYKCIHLKGNNYSYYYYRCFKYFRKSTTQEYIVAKLKGKLYE